MFRSQASVLLLLAIFSCPILNHEAHAQLLGGTLGGAISTTRELAECRSGCENRRDECLQNVLDRYQAADFYCRSLFGGPSSPSPDDYYLCMTELGFGSLSDPLNPLGPLASIQSQREQCRNDCEACKQACNRRFEKRAIRGIIGAIGSF